MISLFKKARSLALLSQYFHHEVKEVFEFLNASLLSPAPLSARQVSFGERQEEEEEALSAFDAVKCFLGRLRI